MAAIIVNAVVIAVVTHH